MIFSGVIFVLMNIVDGSEHIIVQIHYIIENKE